MVRPWKAEHEAVVGKRPKTGDQPDSAVGVSYRKQQGENEGIELPIPIKDHANESGQTERGRTVKYA